MSIPNTENELRQMLLERMQQEYDAFIERLLLQAPEVILRASYEKVFKEDIMQIVENGSLAPEHVRALLKEKNPLEGCYQIGSERKKLTWRIYKIAWRNMRKM